MRVKATHCKSGHPFDILNTIINKSGTQKCRICYNTSRVNKRKENLLYTASPSKKPHKTLEEIMNENIAKNGYGTIIAKALANIAKGIPCEAPEPSKDRPKSWALVDSEFDNLKASDLFSEEE